MWMQTTLTIFNNAKFESRISFINLFKESNLSNCPADYKTALRDELNSNKFNRVRNTNDSDSLY